VNGLDHTLTWLEARALALASDLRNSRKRAEKRAEELLSMVPATLITRVVEKLGALGIDPKQVIERLGTARGDIENALRERDQMKAKKAKSFSHGRHALTSISQFSNWGEVF
jgi:hypothetical protein